jgi:hypothetical protein
MSFLPTENRGTRSILSSGINRFGSTFRGVASTHLVTPDFNPVTCNATRTGEPSTRYMSCLPFISNNTHQMLRAYRTHTLLHHFFGGLKSTATKSFEPMALSLKYAALTTPKSYQACRRLLSTYRGVASTHLVAPDFNPVTSQRHPTGERRLDTFLARRLLKSCNLLRDLSCRSESTESRGDSDHFVGVISTLV